jgi:putative FmdB family regulatory protein
MVVMPTYEWDCVGCRVTWDVVTRIAERDEPQRCPKCQALGTRNPVVLCAIDKSAASDWNNVSYNPGLGCWTKSWKHGREIAKSRGMEEIGNEPVENIHKKYEKQRAETRAKRWEEADRVKVYDD